MERNPQHGLSAESVGGQARLDSLQALPGLTELPGLGTVPAAQEQGALLPIPVTQREIAGPVPDPVAHVHLELQQPHLDRVFDYLIPEQFADTARVGVRVTVDIAGRQASGFIVARDSVTTTASRLRPLRRVVSAVPVLCPEVYEVAQQVAMSHAAPTADVLRLAVPQRHARSERAYLQEHGPIMRDALQVMHARQSEEQAPSGEASEEDALHAHDAERVARGAPTNSAWSSYRGGNAFLSHLRHGAPHAVCCALPGRAGGTEALATAIGEVRRGGRGVLLIAPTTRHAERLAVTLRHLLQEDVALVSGEDALQQRYGTFLRILGGQARIVIGTRAAVWAPVLNLGMCVVVDDAAEPLREIRSPYYHVRSVLTARAQAAQAALLVFSPYVSEESAALVDSGQAVALEGTPQTIRSCLPRVSAAEQWERERTPWSRIPDAVFSLVREALTRGPVLMVVPRAGYVPIVACALCHAHADCPQCSGPLSIAQAQEAPRCSRCGWKAQAWRCPRCGSAQLRAVRIGSHRTAEEIGRAFPGTGIVLSGAHAPDGIIASVNERPRLVVATPGAEPEAPGGFAAAVVLDSRFLQGRGLDAQTQFLRHMARVIIRVRSARQGGHVILAGGADPAITRVLAEWQHRLRAGDALRERETLRLPPASRWFGISGAPRDVRKFLASAQVALWREEGNAPATAAVSGEEIPVDALLVGGVHRLAGGVELLGPVPARRMGEVTVYLRQSRTRADLLAANVRRSYREYTASSQGSPLRIEADPPL